jgi:hypothetical protein
VIEVAKMAKSEHQNNQNGEIDNKAKLLRGTGAKQPEGGNLLLMIAVLFGIFFITLIISKLMQ